jgi:hypothetical protein
MAWRYDRKVMTMGLWEEAQKQQREHQSELERQAEAQREGQRYRASSVQAQQLAVREFIDGMLRLGIAPQQLRFWKYSSWSQRYKMTSRSVFVGICIRHASPTGGLATPQGRGTVT